ncbi:Serine carboxypeptidase-like 19 [Apostasia shenzhenica]|uniref:Serine carboxypeptidase-like 19 n=1 Tax=Apostasia shenzhenica TaxID=1088818 RepID=A0A2I0A252_9ASPA|nr:Serine carboxypeptidase-like 19 [Apostasia shenzhenica]
MSTSSRSAELLFLFLFIVVPFSLSSARFNVTHLPGFDGELPFRLETGYVTVSEETGGELFYYFVESERNPSEDPLILWLSGGPGCSAINSLALDMGPIIFNVEDFDGKLPILYANPYAWTKIANMIFLDWPIGSGFSYSKNAFDYFADDFSTTRSVHKFLKKWFLDHPSFLLNTFYMGGDSYGAKIAVLAAYEIVEANGRGQLPLINIKGYVIGNPGTKGPAPGSKVDSVNQVTHAYGLGVLPREFYLQVVRDCAGENYKAPMNALCAKHLDIINGFIAEINIYSILDPLCDDEPPSLNENSMARSLKDNSAEKLGSSSSDPDINCITAELLVNYWGNHYLVREALHVKERTVGRFHRCKFEIAENFFTCNIPNAVPYHHSLMSKGYRTLVYSGDHDVKIPFFSTLAWIRSLNFTVLKPWHSWKAGDQVAGYATLFSNNLTFTTIKVLDTTTFHPSTIRKTLTACVLIFLEWLQGGSHVAAGKMPMQCFVMFERWSSYQAL